MTEIKYNILMKKIFNNIGKICFVTYLISILLCIILIGSYGGFSLIVLWAWAILDTIYPPHEDLQWVWPAAIIFSIIYPITIYASIVSITSGIKYLSKSNKLDLLKAFLIIPIIILLIGTYYIYMKF